MKRVATLAAALTLGVVSASFAQTITFTGNESDFTSQGVLPIQDDLIDTQEFCGAGQHPLDIGRVYITNDNTSLYMGWQYQRFCFCDINLGIAFQLSGGGTATDPFGRQINWAGAFSPPDFYVYDVIPTDCNPFNYEVLYRSDNAGGWITVMDGPNGLGMVDTDGGNFVELRLPLSTLGAGCQPGSFFDVFFDVFVTQEGNTKPAFDMVANDSQQRSTLAGTCFDVGPTCPPSQPTDYLRYRLQCPTPTAPRTWGEVKNEYR